MVLTAPPVDYLCDHEMTSLLVRDACFAAPIPNYTTRQWDPAPPLAKIPHLYYVDAIEGTDRDGRPQPAGFHVDVSRGLRDQAADARLPRQPARTGCCGSTGSTSTSTARPNGGAQRGAEIGVEHAEAFRQYLGHAYPHDNLLLNLLGQDGSGGPWVEGSTGDDHEAAVPFSRTTSRSRIRGLVVGSLATATTGRSMCATEEGGSFALHEF